MSCISTTRQLAVLGGLSAFSPDHSVPLIHTQGYRRNGDFSVVDAILANMKSDTITGASQQRLVAKHLPGVGSHGPSYRETLQTRIGQVLNTDSIETSVIAITSGTVALRAVLKSVPWFPGSEVIVPMTTVGATVEAVIDEKFVPVFVAVDPDSWLLSPEATKHAITAKTAAIITVDWLGTQCNLEPFRMLADKHNIKLFSDSAQSFGASSGRPPSLSFAHATIYSLGYPKVLSAGSGGLIVCSVSLKEQLMAHPCGILRHEALAEINAYICLQALGSLSESLQTRAIASELYRGRLSSLPGITFQKVPERMATNHYQVSMTVDAEAFKLTANELCEALQLEHVHCSADRMPCVATNDKFARLGRVVGDFGHSRLLAMTSVTLPISNEITLQTVGTICESIELAHRNASDVLEAQQSPVSASTPPIESFDIVDLESKFRNHIIIDVWDDARVHSKVLIPCNYLYEHQISLDNFVDLFKAQKQWQLQDRIGELQVDAMIGTMVILAPYSDTQPAGTGSAIALDESGSSASVELVLAGRSLYVRKFAFGDGIDGNGAPWLRRQALFLEGSEAVRTTNMFVVPTKVDDEDGRVTLRLPYVPSHSFGELAFANVGAKPLVDAMVKMLARMATCVWTKGQELASPNFIKRAHFDRMRRRLEIARAVDNKLHNLLMQKTVILNGIKLLGFEEVMNKLETHSQLANIGPLILSEIHGDLNIHNVLSRLDRDRGEPEALIDPRGVPLFDNEHQLKEKKFERGDYGYDVSKLLFSLSGFSEIRKGVFRYSTDGDSHELEILDHPGSETMVEAANILIRSITANDVMRKWIEKVEPDGLRSFELRAKVAEAAHFVADCACALGRETPWEVVPLFLLGLRKLNETMALLDDNASIGAENSGLPSCVPKSADFGAGAIQHALFDFGRSAEKCPYDVLEFSVKIESVETLKRLLRNMVGTYLPKETAIYLSTDPVKSVGAFPWVVIHPSDGVRGQTHMLAAATRRSTAFLCDNGIRQDIIDSLKIVHISSTGSSSRSQFTARDNDKLLSPGPFGISPLKLAVLQAIQFPFPRPGRWVVENDSFCLVSKPLVMSGNDLCLLAIERPTSDSSSSWRVCIDEVEVRDGVRVAKTFRNIEMDEMRKKLIRTTTGLFLPHRLAKAISLREGDYVNRRSPLLIDIALPHFMKREKWIELCHKQGYGVASHRAWENAESFKDISKQVELADGGDDMAFYHYGSDLEYQKFLASVRDDPRLNSLAYVGAAAQWLENGGVEMSQVAA